MARFKSVKISIIRYFLLLGAIVFGHYSYSQLMNVDSCLNVLKTAKEDTNKVVLLDAIAWEISYTNLQKGIDYSLESYSLAKKLNYARYYSKICNTLAAIYTDMAEIPKALDYCIEGLKYAKENNQLRVQVSLHNTLGNVYSKRRDHRKALYNYLQSIEILKKCDPNLLAVAAVGNIVGIYTGYKKLDSAMYYANICLDYNIKHHNIDRLSNNYISLSEIYYELDDKEKSLKCALNAVNSSLAINDEYTLAHCYIQLGNAHYLNKNYRAAIDAYFKAEICAKKTGDIPALESLSQALSETYEISGDFKNSLKYFRIYKMYSDSALNTESIRQEKNAEAKFENEKKQKEIELLEQKEKVNESENQKKKIYLVTALIGLVVLGFVLVILYRNNLLKQKTNANLEAFNKEINNQKDLVEIKNKEIVDSINYAKRIQQSILTSDHYFKKFTNDFFILFKPKDIVSGDFYWALNHEGKFIVMTADCTGHGVPGAMMSMMGINFLNEIVNEKKISSPADILNQLRSDIIKTLNPEGSLIESKDGLDCCLCSFDFTNMKLKYANANNSFYIIRGNELIVTKVNKMPVGAGHNAYELFTEQEIAIFKNDLIITFTDGYADQFGGDKGKKFKYKQLEELLINYSHLPLTQLKEKLNDTIEQWRGDLEQVDDICVIGIKI